MVTLAFPNALIYPETSPEFTVTIAPAMHSDEKYIFDETAAIRSTNTKRRKYTVVNASKAKYVPKEHLHQFSQDVRVKKIVPHAILPKRQTPGAVGFDVHSIHDQVIPPQTIIPIHTGLAMDIPQPLYLRIASRSSFAAKGIVVTGGVIDNDYRGEIKVLLHNTTNQPFTINYKERIAQFIFEVCQTPCMILSSKLSKTQRGHNGFGSTNNSIIHDYHF